MTPQRAARRALWSQARAALEGDNSLMARRKFRILALFLDQNVKSECETNLPLICDGPDWHIYGHAATAHAVSRQFFHYVFNPHVLF